MCRQIRIREIADTALPSQSHFSQCDQQPAIRKVMNRFCAALFGKTLSRNPPPLALHSGSRGAARLKGTRHVLLIERLTEMALFGPD